MAAFRPLTESEVTFTFRLEHEEESVRGSFGYDTEEENKAAEDEILARLERGDERAWCWIQVTARDAEGNEGTDSLRCVNLGEDAGWGDQLEAHVRETFPDLWTEALHSLNAERLRKHTPRLQRVCQTKYLGPTDHRGSRVRARHVTTRKSVTIPWDHALNAFENHAEAAERVLGARPQWGASVDGGGYLFGVDPASVED
jgi:hypothetical protein